MTQEEKELLLTDLCARLPYGVICTDSRHGDSIITELDTESEIIYFDDVDEYAEIKNCKPYLRSMSSMTGAEREEYELLANHCIVTSIEFIHFEAASLIDWLNKHHFDYRGLIPKGLAIEVIENPFI